MCAQRAQMANKCALYPRPFLPHEVRIKQNAFGGEQWRSLICLFDLGEQGEKLSYDAERDLYSYVHSPVFIITGCTI